MVPISIFVVGRAYYQKVCWFKVSNHKNEKTFVLLHNLFQGESSLLLQNQREDIEEAIDANLGYSLFGRNCRFSPVRNLDPNLSLLCLLLLSIGETIFCFFPKYKMNSQFSASLVPQLDKNSLKIYSNDSNELLLDESIQFASPRLSIHEGRVAVSSAMGITIINIKNGDRKDISYDEQLHDFSFDPVKKGKGFAISTHLLLEWNLEKSKVKRFLNYL
jgi:hypothetical protein